MLEAINDIDCNDDLTDSDERPSESIGGYFALERCPSRASLHPDALGFQSGRAALLALLSHTQPSRLWLPRYVCSVVPATVEAAGVPQVAYSLGEDMRIAWDVVPKPNDWILCVNYFGLSPTLIRDALSRFSPGQVIIDAAQSLFFTCQDARAVFYSPRKFVGLPDGGLLVTKLPVDIPAKIDKGSIMRCKHLLMRLDGRVEEGYPEFQKAQASLARQGPIRISNLTASLLLSTDYDWIAARRRENYAVLAEQFANIGECAFSLSADTVPLCYPLIGVNADQLRGLLLDYRIYTPRYWPDITETNSLTAWERLLVDGTVFLPCDQRYGVSEMARLAELVRKLL